MVRPHANQNLVMQHTLKRSVPIPCGSNTQDFDTNPFSVRGSCLKPSHQPQVIMILLDREAERFTLRSSPMETAGDVQALLDAELRRITDERLLAKIRELLVPPEAVEREWDYGAPDERFICWTILEHLPSNTGIAYCAHGFGPRCPWGLVFLSGPHMNIGMDCGWYASLEDVFRESRAWEGPNPEGYESN